MPRACWTDDEPGLADFKRELAAAMRRANVRLPRIFVIATLVTAAVVFIRARRQGAFDASIVIRVTEDAFDEDTRPPTGRDIAAHLHDVAFTRKNLFALIREHNLYEDKMGFDENFALETFREDIDMTVGQNYFSPERYIEDVVRSARIVVTYYGKDPDVTLAVVRDLGKLVGDVSHDDRVEVSSATAHGAEEMKGALEQRLAKLKAEQTAIELTKPRMAIHIVKLRRLSQQIENAERELAAVGSQSTRLDLRSELEEGQGGLRFEIVDEGRPPKVILTKQSLLTILGIVVFTIMMPLTWLMMGFMDLRVQDAATLQRLGLKPLGRVPLTGVVGRPHRRPKPKRIHRLLRFFRLKSKQAPKEALS